MKALYLVLCALALDGNPSGVERRPIAGEVVLELAGGDYLYPRFSPDGRTLAFVSVTFADDVELDEVKLLDLASRRTRTLLDAKSARKLAAYSAFVSDLEWSGPTRLRVAVSDGDVDTEHLTFDTTTRRVVASHHTSGDDPVRPDYFAEPAFAAPDGRVVHQDFASGDDGVWLIDPKTKARAPVLPRPHGAVGFWLRGGAYVGRSYLLFLETVTSTRAVVVDGAGAVRELGEIASIPPFSATRVLRRSETEVAVLVFAHRGAERGSNPIYVYDGRSLIASSDYTEVADADVDPSGRLVAFSVWGEGDARHIVVRRMR
jgi:dipeptidyl aminopeptidase/acylaminoacyl peptidase